MRKTVFFLVIVFLFSFIPVSAQTIETLAPTNLGDYLSWDDQGLYILAMLANVNLSDSSFTWSTGPDDQYGSILMGTYSDAGGTYLYTFQIDKNTMLLMEVVYSAMIHDNAVINSMMKDIKETYGLDQAQSYAHPALTAEFAQYASMMDEFKTVANDSTICTYGYLSAEDGKDGMIFLDFLDRSYYQDPVG